MGAMKCACVKIRVFLGVTALRRAIADRSHTAHKGLTSAGESDKTLACGIPVRRVTASGLLVTRV